MMLIHTSLTGLRTCLVCGKEKPFDEFNILRDQGTKVIQRNICRDCRNRRKREKRVEEKKNPSIKLNVSVPRRYEDAVRDIWNIVGSNPFIWQTIKGKHRSYSKMTLSHLKKNQIVKKLGPVSYLSDAAVWRFTESAVLSFQKTFGPARSDAAEVCKKSIDDCREHLKNISR